MGERLVSHELRRPPGGLFAAVVDPTAPGLRPLPPQLNAALPSAARQRTKLWELVDAFHCSIIGTCLTTGELRRTMAKVAQSRVSAFSDHDLHTDAVNLCSRRNPGSKLLNKALDARHQAVIKRFAGLPGEASVLQAWEEARRTGDIPGAYWAVLTHPDVGHVGLRHAFGDVHMLSHLVGAANRADIRRLSALEAENAKLQMTVERQQARMQEAVTSREATIRQLGALAASQVKAAADPDDDDALAAALRRLVGDLQDRLAAETGRSQRLDRRLADATEASQRCERRARQAEAECRAIERELGSLSAHYAAASKRETLLPETVLYVGGRQGCIEQIRDALAAAGGELLRHDGGQHDHPSLLPGLISRADRVVFPVDCISHDAALAVKRVCRQHDKPWLVLRSSGFGSFLAALSASAPIGPAAVKHSSLGDL